MISETEFRPAPKVKVCGMTRASDVRMAVAAGVDAIGVIMHAESPRQATLEQATAIRAEIPAFVTMVGVFVNADADRIDALARHVGLDLCQLHGDETDAFGASLQQPYIKALRVRDKMQLASQLNEYPQARGLLLDAYVQGQHGGTGHQIDAELWPQAESLNLPQKLILAGGLTPDNVAAAVDQTRPFAVDLNSGIETRPGVKSASLLHAALRALGRG